VYPDRLRVGVRTDSSKWFMILVSMASLIKMLFRKMSLQVDGLK
jgi:hypothetical protein